MNNPKDFNAHNVNDYLNQHPELNPFEFRIAYYTIHGDYGRRKGGLFWEGAQSIQPKIGIDRRVIRKCWRKMKEKGWLIDTGKQFGKATLWKINYPQLQKEAEAFKEQRKVARDYLPGIVQELMDIPSPNDVHPMQACCTSHVLPDVHGDATTLPKKASQISHLNKDADTVSKKPIGDYLTIEEEVRQRHPNWFKLGDTAPLLSEEDQLQEE